MLMEMKFWSSTAIKFNIYLSKRIYSRFKTKVNKFDEKY